MSERSISVVQNDSEDSLCPALPSNWPSPDWWFDQAVLDVNLPLNVTMRMPPGRMLVLEMTLKVARDVKVLHVTVETASE